MNESNSTGIIYNRVSRSRNNITNRCINSSFCSSSTSTNKNMTDSDDEIQNYTIKNNKYNSNDNYISSSPTGKHNEHLYKNTNMYEYNKENYYN